jgi:hypothetical protein
MKNFFEEVLAWVILHLTMVGLWRNPITVFRLGVDENKPLNSRFSGAGGADRRGQTK